MKERLGKEWGIKGAKENGEREKERLGFGKMEEENGSGEREDDNGITKDGKICK